MTTFPHALAEIDRLFSRFLQLEILGMPNLSAKEQSAAHDFGTQLTAMKFLCAAIADASAELQDEWWAANGDDISEFVAMAKAFIDSI